jgi:hypothetical protein
MMVDQSATATAHHVEVTQRSRGNSRPEMPQNDGSQVGDPPAYDMKSIST